MVQIPEPINTITTTETFNTIQKATAAVTGIYFNMSYGNGNISYANSAITLDAGMTADELNVYGTTSYYQTNSILPSDGGLITQIWSPAYFDLYAVNATIEGIAASKNLPVNSKNELIGECKFLRAFCNFYLVNLFGDVPLATTSSFATNSLASRTPERLVYNQIITDLKDAQTVLPADYSISGAANERIRANKWAATALLARAYLYVKAYDSAEAQASAVIEQSGIYSLTGLDSTFLKNNTEAILQLQIVDANLYATTEGYQFIPAYLTKDFSPGDVSSNWQYFVPPYYLTSQLVNAFEPGDLRMSKWIDSTGVLDGTNYYYPFKYKVRKGTSDNISEYYTLLRLGEQYLIRAEARAQQNKISEAQTDLNMVRARAGLSNTTASDKLALLSAVLHERQVELFAEMGHRWLDLKRTMQADAVLGPVKGGNWKTAAQLWPIPQSELQANPNLEQNPGYN